jgi:hypothetical protein
MRTALALVFMLSTGSPCSPATHYRSVVPSAAVVQGDKRRARAPPRLAVEIAPTPVATPVARRRRPPRLRRSPGEPRGDRDAEARAVWRAAQSLTPESPGHRIEFDHRRQPPKPVIDESWAFAAHLFVAWHQSPNPQTGNGADPCSVDTTAAAQHRAFDKNPRQEKPPAPTKSVPRSSGDHRRTDQNLLKGDEDVRGRSPFRDGQGAAWGFCRRPAGRGRA